MAFIKKELKAIFRTYRFWVIPLVFLLFALMSPPTAKLTPQLLESVMPKGMGLKVPEPQLTDAFAQWFKNLSQIGILGVILLTMGIVAEEKTSHTIVLIVTKPVSRAAVVLAKFLAQAFWMLVSFFMAAAVCYGYAIIVFKPARAAEFAWANALFGLYILLVVAITIFFSTIMNNQVAAGGLSLVVVMSLSLAASLSKVFDKYAPTGLTTIGMKAALGNSGLAAAQAAWPAVTSFMLICVLLAGAIYVFNKQEL
jgi:ABC-2 type transport system permease protein